MFRKLPKLRRFPGLWLPLGHHDRSFLCSSLRWFACAMLYEFAFHLLLNSCYTILCNGDLLPERKKGFTSYISNINVWHTPKQREISQQKGDHTSNTTSSNPHRYKSLTISNPSYISALSQPFLASLDNVLHEKLHYAKPANDFRLVKFRSR